MKTIETTVVVLAVLAGTPACFKPAPYSPGDFAATSGASTDTGSESASSDIGTTGPGHGATSMEGTGSGGESTSTSSTGDGEPIDCSMVCADRVCSNPGDLCDCGQCEGDGQCIDGLACETTIGWPQGGGTFDVVSEGVVFGHWLELADPVELTELSFSAGIPSRPTQARVGLYRREGSGSAALVVGTSAEQVDDEGGVQRFPLSEAVPIEAGTYLLVMHFDFGVPLETQPAEGDVDTPYLFRPFEDGLPETWADPPKSDGERFTIFGVVNGVPAQ